MLWFSKAAQVFAIYLAEIVTYLTILRSKDFLKVVFIDRNDQSCLKEFGWDGGVCQQS